MYLFQDDETKLWYFGETPSSECPSGIFRLVPSEDGKRVSIRHIDKDVTLMWEKPFDSFLNKVGVSYATMADFLKASKGFFSRSKSIRILTAAGATTTLQIATMNLITNLAVADFTLPENALFMLKNDGPAQIELQVKLANSVDWITTKFDPGWNPEILKAVKTNASADINLKYGY